MEPFRHRSCVRKVPGNADGPKDTSTHPTARPHNKSAVQWRVLPGTFAHPQTSYHVPRGIPATALAMTHKARSIARSQIKTPSNACADAKSNHRDARQSRQARLVPSAFLSASSGTFNSLFKVLFIFPSWYLFTIGLEPIFSCRWNLPPILRSNPEERDS